MDKTLAQKITENTKKVVAERDAEKRIRIKKIVYENLEGIIREKVLEGKRIFTMDEETIGITLDEICSREPLSNEDKIQALRDIGFETDEYPMGYFMKVPKENVSEEVQKLLDMYDKNFKEFEASVKKVARKHCTDVLKKLDDGKYDVDRVNQVTVEYTSSLDNEMYKKQVKKIMQEYGFEVYIGSNAWVITVIEDEGD